MHNIEIPSSSQFLTDLILQRTGPFLKLGGKIALNNWAVKGDINGLANYLSVNNLTSKYLNMVIDDFKIELNEIKKNIQRDSLFRIASIGPGNGLLELLLVREGITTDLLLIDIERTAEHYHGFNVKGSGYASLSSTKNFIERNIDTTIRIQTCNPTIEPLPDFNYNLLISILSMGFHYPCDDYINFIINNSSENSLVVFDKRIGAPDSGFQKISTYFTQKHLIKGQKHIRYFLQRQI
jgi:hypothetical protein